MSAPTSAIPDTFHPNHVSRTGLIEVDAPVATVFPLLCPVRERDWIPGWDARILFSDSGLIEDNCVFTSANAELGEGLYVCSRHEPENGLVEFVVFYPGACVMRLDIAAAPTVAGGTRLRWRRTYTGLSEAGNAFIARMTDEVFQKQVAALGQFLQRYCQSLKQR